jgi:hypothetical protein
MATQQRSGEVHLQLGGVLSVVQIGQEVHDGRQWQWSAPVCGPCLDQQPPVDVHEQAYAVQHLEQKLPGLVAQVVFGHDASEHCKQLHLRILEVLPASASAFKAGASSRQTCRA